MARTGTRSRRTGRARRGLRADGVNGILISQDWGGRDMIHCGGGRNKALKYLVSREGDGERIRGSVMKKVCSDISRQTLQEGSS